MRITIFATVLAAMLIAPVASFADNIRITEFRDERGKSTFYSATKEMMAKSPAWDLNGNPPLSIGAAVGVAKDWVRAKFPSFKSTQVWNISLGRVWQEEMKDRWYYDINIEGVANIDDVEARRHFMVIILMDGTVVEPSDKE